MAVFCHVLEYNLSLFCSLQSQSCNFFIRLKGESYAVISTLITQITVGNQIEIYYASTSVWLGENTWGKLLPQSCPSHAAPALMQLCQMALYQRGEGAEWEAPKGHLNPLSLQSASQMLGKCLFAYLSVGLLAKIGVYFFSPSIHIEILTTIGLNSCYMCVPWMRVQEKKVASSSPVCIQCNL